jgi:hypothetical protein
MIYIYNLCRRGGIAPRYFELLQNSNVSNYTLRTLSNEDESSRNNLNEVPDVGIQNQPLSDDVTNPQIVERDIEEQDSDMIEAESTPKDEISVKDSNLPSNFRDNQHKLNLPSNDSIDNEDSVFKESPVFDGSDGKDSLITPDMMSSLSMFVDESENDVLMSSIYEFEKSRLSKYAVPDENFSHFKVPGYAELARASSIMIGANYINWSFTIEHFLKFYYHMFKRIKPVDNVHLDTIGRYLAHNEQLRSSPIFSLSPIKQYYISHALYGVSHGAQDLINFIATDHDTLNFRYSYSSYAKSNIRNEIVLSLNGESSNKQVYKSDLYDKIFDTDLITTKFRVDEPTSIFFRHNVKSIVSEMYDISLTDVEIETSQSKSTTRSAFIMRPNQGSEGENITDGFEVQLNINKKFNLSEIDKTIIDMLVSLFHIKRYVKESSEPGSFIQTYESDYLLNYVATCLQKYVINQMFIDQGVVITKLSLNINIVRKKNFRTYEQLSAYYTKLVECGKIVPISSLHALFYLKSSSKNATKALDIKEWEDYIVDSSIANVSINSQVRHIMPRLEVQSKHHIRDIAMNRNLLNSQSYLNFVAPIGMTRDTKIEIEFREFIKELFIRSLLREGVPEYIPLFTLGRWNFGTLKTPHIKTSYNHSLAKFKIENLFTNMRVISKQILLDRDVVYIPKYIKGSSMLVGGKPDVVHRIISSLDDDA